MVSPARLTISQRTETALEQRNDGSRPHNVPVATNPRITLSPISHFSLPEPFNPLTPTGGSPKRHAHSIIRRGHQDAESEVHPSGLTFVSALSLNRSSLNRLLAMLSHPVCRGYLLRWLVVGNYLASVNLEQATIAHRFTPSTREIIVLSVTRKLDHSIRAHTLQRLLGSPRKTGLKEPWEQRPKPELVQALMKASPILDLHLGTPRSIYYRCVRLPLL